jgi:hypothetical protein
MVASFTSACDDWEEKGTNEHTCKSENRKWCELLQEVHGRTPEEGETVVRRTTAAAVCGGA